MYRKPNDINLDEVIDNISIGLTAALGISGAVMCTMNPATFPFVPTIQAAAYVPALITIAVKRLIEYEL